ncbi:hypothetical protein BN938_1953 [Mucinivorans hirudinis]|uniref:Uncharacterized protein n=1 Tax=Mucinivorans hirudinis TaxID=1433126 RepID=A0A060R8Z5_9BACT|nr:hypothetical protein BN938_1953 [Mucinivorans hirudinis]
MEIITTSINGVTKLEAPQGYYLIRNGDNGEQERDFAKIAFLAQGDSAENWSIVGES